MTDSNHIIIYGSGGLGRGILELIKSINKHSSEKWIVDGFIDDRDHNRVNGYEVIGDIHYLQRYMGDINVVLGFGSPEVKKDIFEKLQHKNNITFPNIIHPNVDVSPFNQFGKGNIISYGVALSTNIEIGDFNLIHYNCSIGHDVKLDNFNSVFPLSALSGFVELANCVEIGTNAAIIPNKKIKSYVRVGAGSVVIEDLYDNQTVVGSPARPL